MAKRTYKAWVLVSDKTGRPCRLNRLLSLYPSRRDAIDTLSLWDALGLPAAYTPRRVTVTVEVDGKDGENE